MVCEMHHSARGLRRTERCGPNCAPSQFRHQRQTDQQQALHIAQTPSSTVNSSSAHGTSIRGALSFKRCGWTHVTASRKTSAHLPQLGSGLSFMVCMPGWHVAGDQCSTCHAADERVHNGVAGRPLHLALSPLIARSHSLLILPHQMLAHLQAQQRHWNAEA